MPYVEKQINSNFQNKKVKPVNCKAYKVFIRLQVTKYSNFYIDRFL